jgi:integrase
VTALDERFTLAEWKALVSDATDTRYQELTGLGPAVKLFQVYQRLAMLRSENTVRGYNGHLKALAWAYPDKEPGEITADEIESVLVAIVSYASRSQAHAAFSSFFKWAKKKKLVPENPMEDVACPTFQPKPLDPRELWSEDERSALRHQQTPYDRLGVELVLSGMRPFEQRAVQVKDVDLVNRRLVIRHGKGGKPRISQFTQDGAMHRALLLYLHTPVRLSGGSERLPDRPVDFLLHKRDGNNWGRWHVPGTALSGSAYAAWWRRMCDHAGVRYRKPYIGRHTFGTELARAGARAEVIKKAMGHASIQTTYAHYIHADDDDVMAALTLIEDPE